MPDRPERPRGAPRAEKEKGPPSSLYGEKIKKTVSIGKEEKPKIPFFVSLTHSMGRAFSGFGKNAKFSTEQSDAFLFLSWDISPEEFYATYKALFMVGIVLGAVVATVLFLVLGMYGIDDMIRFGVAGLCLLAPVVASYYYLKYPYSAVERQKMVSLAYIPEIVNYLSMSLRLTPNLERAVQFAAEHGRGKIAEDLKKIVWDVQIGRFLSVEEALDDLAYRWGTYNEDFKHALMLIRASVLEADKAEREEMLERASSDVLEGTKEKMDLYARKLHQPTVYLYYFGILLPLLLAIILPIGGSMTGQQLAKPEYLLLAYNIVIPVIVFIFGSNILAGRPPTYVPPDVPADFPGLKTHGGMKVLAIVLVFVLIYLGYATDQGDTQGWLNSVVLPANNLVKTATSGFVSGGMSIPGVGDEGITITGTLGEIPAYANKAEELKKIPHITYFYTEFGLFIGLFTIFGVLIGLSVAVSLWLLAEYSERKKIQDEIRGMETEFKDAMYVLASRLGENKPIEEALRSAVQFLPKSAIANNVFRRVLENITTMGMTLDAAIFDETFGALKNLPSRTIVGGMKFLVDSVELGVNVAAKSLINLSIQLRNSQKIDEALRKLLEDVTTMLKTMATFVAPIVLAVVSSMQRLIINSISSSGAGATENSALSSSGVSGMGGMQITNWFANPDIAKTTAEPAVFVAIMGVYVIEIVILLTYFNSQVEDSNNKLHTYASIAASLPIAIILYCVVAYFTGSMLGTGG